MNVFGIIFTLVAAGMMLSVPRRWAPLPMIVAAGYVHFSQQLEIGPLHFTEIRILIAIGLLRVLFRGEGIAGGLNTLDRMVLLWALWEVASIVFHKSSVFVFRLGETYTILGSYFLFRVFINDLEDIRHLFKMVCYTLAPLAVTMFIEKRIGQNPLSLIEFGPAGVAVTNGHYRAQGAFAHPILAGTVGGVCLPMAIYLWRQNRKAALVGLAATGGIVYASGSSGPIMTAFSAMGAVALWRFRAHLKKLRWLAAAMILALNCVMNDPVYFLMARIDVTGGSTGYFRAQLIRSSLEHFEEWWLAGTDVTRHWMATGQLGNTDHTDITNYYIQMAVWGGLPLVLLFVGVLITGFITIGRVLRRYEQAPVDDRLLLWTLGAILFSHATTFMSISYFDQTVVFLFLLLAAIGSVATLQPASEPENEPPPFEENQQWPHPFFQTSPVE